MSRLVLYRAIASPPARAVSMLADILGLQMEVTDVNILKMEHKTPEFKKLNPMGTVPVLRDGSFVLAESNAIMKYLLHKYGSAEARERLYPSEVHARALVDQCLFFNAGVFFIALRNVGAETLMGNLEEPRAPHRAAVGAAYDVVEAYLAGRAYLAAGRLTLADLAAGSTATAIQVIHPLDPDRYPRSADWLARLEEENFFKTVNKEGADYFARLLTGSWQRNRKKNLSRK